MSLNAMATSFSAIKHILVVHGCIDIMLAKKNLNIFKYNKIFGCDWYLNGPVLKGMLYISLPLISMPPSVFLISDCVIFTSVLFDSTIPKDPGIQKRHNVNNFNNGHFPIESSFCISLKGISKRLRSISFDPPKKINCLETFVMSFFKIYCLQYIYKKYNCFASNTILIHKIMFISGSRFHHFSYFRNLLCC